MKTIDDITGLRIVRGNRTVYALCPRCGMDTLWPSWCKCRPKRVVSMEKIKDLL